MRRLILLRHAKAARPEGLDDFDRPLAKRGRRDSPLVGRYLQREGLVPELALVSPARRTRETWDLVGEALGDVPVRFERGLYEARAEDIAALVRAVGPEVASVILVGHNPGLEDLARLLTGRASPGEQARMLLKFPTGAVAVLDFAGADWALRPRSAKLERFVTPDELGEEGG